MQTKKQSLIESLINVAIGYTISLASLFLIFPVLGIESSVKNNLIITLYFTVISIARSYLLRRFFNRKTKPVRNLQKYIHDKAIEFKRKTKVSNIHHRSQKFYGQWEILQKLSDGIKTGYFDRRVPKD